MARSNVALAESVTRIDVVYVPGAVITPMYPPVMFEGNDVGSGAPSCTRIPGITVAPGVSE